MRDGEIVLQELKNDEQLEALRLNLKLYGFDLTVDKLKEMLTVSEPELLYTNGLSGYSKQSAVLLQVKKVITNTRGTLKLVLMSNGKFLCFNKECRPIDIDLFNTSYDVRTGVIWEQIKVGIYVVFNEDHYEQKYRVATLTDCMDRVQAEHWLSLYTGCLKKRQGFQSTEEMRNLQHIKNEGMVATSILQTEFDDTNTVIALINKLENEETIKKADALKNDITITVGKTSKIVITGLDNHTYSVEAPPTKVWDTETFTAFIYRHRYQWKKYDQDNVKSSTLYPALMQILASTREDWFNLSVDNKPPVKIAIKHIQNKRGQETTIAYLNNKRVAYEDMYQAVFKYFLQGAKLEDLTEEPEDLDEAEKQRHLQVKKMRDEGIITSGIHGYITDLEGETPITIGFEKEGASWNLVIGEKRILLKGGVVTIKSLERVLKGTAQGYNSRHSTHELYQRLCKVLTSDEAIEIILEAKEMGKLLKALEVKGQHQ